MDCVIPGHSVRTFSSAIQCLSKISKDLYFDFDAMDGLCLRALNDAKSAYCAIEFAPCFFDHCSSPAIRSSSSSSTRRRKKKNKRQKRSHDNNNDDEEEEEDNGVMGSSQETRFSCRVPMRALAPVVRPRKGVIALRIRSEGFNHINQNDDDDDNHSATPLQLAFEFELEVDNSSLPPSVTYDPYPRSNNKSTWAKVIHRICVAQVDNIAAIAPKDESSELVARPKTLLKWLEPIKKTAEGCMIFNKNADVVIATSFHPNDHSSATGLAPKTSILQTETVLQIQDLEEFEFQDLRRQPSADQQAEAMDDPTTPNCPMPDNVNEEVVLVFGMKEAKALFQFCVQQSSYSACILGDNWMDEEGNNRHGKSPWSVALNFHWAGRPLILESKSPESLGVSIQMVLATLDHSILKNMPMMQQRERQQQEQQNTSSSYRRNPNN